MWATGTGQIDMAHALTAHLGQGHLDAALLAHHAAVLEALVFAAQALVVADRAEHLGAEQAIALRLEGAVVDGLRLLDLAVRPGSDHLGRREGNTDGIELQRLSLLFDDSEKIFHDLASLGKSGPAAEGQQPVFACTAVAVAIKAGQGQHLRLAPGTPDQSCSSSMLMPSERISLTSTLNDSGIPASILWSPSTMFLYILVRPATSSDFTVSISCRVCAAP